MRPFPERRLDLPDERDEEQEDLDELEQLDRLIDSLDEDDIEAHEFWERLYDAVERRRS